MIYLSDGHSQIEDAFLKEFNIQKYEISQKPFSQGFCDLFRFFVLEQTEVYEKKDLYYAFIELPEFWQLHADADHGKIRCYDEIKGYAYVREPKIERIIDRIEWVDENKKVYKMDCYNEYGFVYCSRFIDHGVIVMDVYSTKDRVEIFEVNYTNGVVTTFKNNMVYSMFQTIDDFTQFVFEKVSLKEEILISSIDLLNQFSKSTKINTLDASLYAKAKQEGYQIVLLEVKEE